MRSLTPIVLFLFTPLFLLILFVQLKTLRTWEWGDNARLRGYAHPLIFASLYKCLEVFGLDSRFAVAWLPHV